MDPIPGFQALVPLPPGQGWDRFSAHSSQLRRDVVLEVFSKAMLDTPEVSRRLAERAATVDHPALSTPLQVSSLPDGGFCMAFEPVAGTTLSEHLARGGPMIPDDAVVLFSELSTALSALHQ